MITFVLNNQSILCNSLFFPNKRVSKLKWPIKLGIVGVGGGCPKQRSRPWRGNTQNKLFSGE